MVVNCVAIDNQTLLEMLTKLSKTENVPAMTDYLIVIHIRKSCEPPPSIIGFMKLNDSQLCYSNLYQTYYCGFEIGRHTNEELQNKLDFIGPGYMIKYSINDENK